MTTLASYVTFYRSCKACLHRWTSRSKDSPCPRCGSDSTRIRGIKLPDSPPPRPDPRLN